MQDTPKLSIIVVSYNTRQVTLECLRSIFQETTETTFEIIVVDNDSQDGSADAIASEFLNVKLLTPNENLGFGKANNLAAQHAKGDLLLLLNPDTVVLDGAIDTLVRFADQQPQSGIWGGRTLFPDRTLNPTSCWRAMSIWGLFCWAVGLNKIAPKSTLFNYDGYGNWQRDSVRTVDTVTGCLLLIGRQDWEALGGFDTTFYMYGEEADLCARARRRGARPLVTPDAEIIHYGGLSETVRSAKMERLFRAKISLAVKHWSPARLFICRVLFRLLVAIRVLGYAGLSIFSDRPGIRDKAATWKEVWANRSDWLKGYT